MAVKTFTAGEVLNASDTNTYLANAGLVYVKSTTVGAGVASVAVSSAFLADYDNYLITYTGGVLSAATNIRLQLGATTAGYYFSFIYNPYSSATVFANVNDNNGAIFSFVGAGNTNYARLTANVYNPFTANRTAIATQYSDASNGGTGNGYLDNATSYTAFTLSPSTGTMTGGTITVYGYRKA